MTPALVFCAIFTTGSVSAELVEKVTKSREISPAPAVRSELSSPRPTAKRSARTMNEGAMRPPLMPYPPTDPRAFVGGDLPQQPMMNVPSTMPTMAKAGLGLRTGAAGMAENAGHAMANQKTFGHHKPASAVSPWQRLYNQNTGNGTVNPYYSTIRPEEEQQRANQEFDRETSRFEGESEQPVNFAPRAFSNYGQYYPNYSAEQ